MQKNKHWYIYISSLIGWTFIAFLSFWSNTKSADSGELIYKILLIHVLLWILGFIFSIPFISMIYVQKRKIEKLLNNQKNYYTLFNFFNSPAFLFDKARNKFVKANKTAVLHFNINSNSGKGFEISELDCLKQQIEQYKDSIIKNIKLHLNCIDSKGNNVSLDVIMHDIFMDDLPVTLIVLNDSSKNNKDIQEMNDYIEDLRASESMMEDNAFELIQLNIKLEESENNLKEANAAKDKFFSIVAHDLKSPFVGLLGITEMLDTDYDDFEEKERRELIHNLYESSKNTFELLEGLLDWARVKQGRMPYNPMEFNLFHLTDSLVNLLKANAFKKNITLKNSIEINTFAFGDKNMISTVLRNLLANAIKFTPQNGNVFVTAKIENDLMKISVVDSGIGMSPKNQEKLFRIDVSHNTLGTNDEKGTGLGLILCKELVETHGTKIWAESKLGKGSIFSFNIPLSINRN